MFDEEPDGDPHGECQAEIRRLQEQLTTTEAERDEWRKECAVQAETAAGLYVALNKALEQQ